MTTPASPAIGAFTPYQALPALTEHPASRCSWDAFGPGDEFGTLNRLTPRMTRAAAGTVRAGKAFPVNWAVELPDPPLFGRSPVRRAAAFGGGFADDKLDDFYLQGSTQWDSLAHAAHPVHGFYGGPPRDVSGLCADARGIHVWARRGIAGRFVLADVARWRAAQGRPLDPAEPEPVAITDVAGTLEAQHSTLEPGDILLIRVGWVGWYDTASTAQRQALAAGGQPPAVGLAAGTETCAWLWDSGIAAVAADNPAVEKTPTPTDPYESLHFTLLPLLGMPLGELFALDALAADCAADGCYSGLFTSAPLNVWGGVGSPANALCLK